MFPHAPEPWVDLSTGINPHPYPLFELPATVYTRLPEPGRAEELRRAARACYEVPPDGGIVAAPGTQILLPQAMALVPPGTAKILGPTYAEHARAATLVGHRVETVSDVAALADADLAVVVNPNNPDGRVTPRADLLDLARELVQKGGLLVVDEAFMDVGPDVQSVCRDAGMPGLVVLRSFGKFFGLAGVRLGFALAERGIARRLDDGFGPWAVSGPALEYGIRALGDRSWQASMRNRLRGEVERLDAVFGAVGVKVSGGTDLFRFIEDRRAAGLFEALGQAGIATRRFSWSSAALRCGLPGNEADWRRLERALGAWQNGDRREKESIA